MLMFEPKRTVGGFRLRWLSRLRCLPQLRSDNPTAGEPERDEKAAAWRASSPHSSRCKSRMAVGLEVFLQQEFRLSRLNLVSAPGPLWSESNDWSGRYAAHSLFRNWEANVAFTAASFPSPLAAQIRP
jgi:hypothetical protein